ncbi:L-threonylcarbamoyladenylate synthase [Fluviispira multicolorata]|uniref:Threonylcarbamoyl-AMP synthase n=1 Tax=Fluviispira multicolorata TaxID=2654512 RepID=A0A833JFE6_9BACT|nr:L-threonylcarbamoyladenylate synthase [Fluviispira multicolorata]KAB8030929.1 threonylcarbamoyl-AMP synthase [Fluviispira multicolorata]
MKQKSSEKLVAKILPLSEESLTSCANALISNSLVAFPTETVFGLGANALSESATEKIFAAKGRPKSDPLIVHISFMRQAESLTKMSGFQRQCFDILGSNFWPGPLTLIVKASDIVPKIITAGGDSIALRIPSHHVAQELLKRANIPVAAPSANRFGHVSPTTAQHVFDDLGNVEDLSILDHSEACTIGIESTVIKISEENNISLLRPGAISSLQIKNALNEAHINFTFHVIKREIKLTDLQKANKNEMSLDAPGQLLTHYAPSIEAFIMGQPKVNNETVQNFEKSLLKSAVIIDFSQKNKNLSSHCLKYLDLSSQGNCDEASHNLFSCLRMAENIEGAKYILLPDLNFENNEKILAVFDRIFRAASGKYIQIVN